jgi:hypothetical protein
MKRRRLLKLGLLNLLLGEACKASAAPQKQARDIAQRSNSRRLARRVSTANQAEFTDVHEHDSLRSPFVPR